MREPRLEENQTRTAAQPYRKTAEHANVLVESVATPQPIAPGASAIEQQQRAFELGNAAILASALGLGAYVDFRA